MKKQRIFGAALLLCLTFVVLFILGGRGQEKGKTELIMLPAQGEAQMLSAMVYTAGGKLIVVDGGWETDGQALAEKIMEKGGQVDAWFLTHPHSDHVGALYDILKNRSDQVTIKKIYYSFADPDWYIKASPEDPGMAGALLEEFQKLPEGVTDNTIRKGTTVQVDDVTVTVMNDRYELETDPVNNSDMIFQMEVKGIKVLFLGDMGYEGGRRLLEDLGPEALKSDMVQMAHHGQNGVGKEVYQAIAPQVCLWPTPQWLWDNDSGDGPGSGPWDTWTTRSWMEELGVKENYCTKDGEIKLLLE